MEGLPKVTNSYLATDNSEVEALKELPIDNELEANQIKLDDDLSLNEVKKELEVDSEGWIIMPKVDALEIAKKRGWKKQDGSILDKQAFGQWFVDDKKSKKPTGENFGIRRHTIKGKYLVNPSYDND